MYLHGHNVSEFNTMISNNLILRNFNCNQRNCFFLGQIHLVCDKASSWEHKPFLIWVILGLGCCLILMRAFEFFRTEFLKGFTPEEESAQDDTNKESSDEEDCNNASPSIAHVLYFLS